MDLEPIAVLLKFGFVAVLYLFLFWIARSALRDLRRTAAPIDDTGIHQTPRGEPELLPEAALVAQGSGGGLEPGARFDLFGGITIGRSAEADVRLDDRYASGIHARIDPRRGHYYVEDLNSTNGTRLNSKELRGRARLNPGDLIQIGDAKLRYEVES